jgi:toxin-antitoxin system PIN domain toxin
MKIVDLNILLYAVNRDAEQHAAARKWVDDLFGGDEPVGLPWILLLGFLRIATNARVFPKPLKPSDALAVVDAWLDQPAVVALAPGQDHWTILRQLLAVGGIGANGTSDAHLAAIAIEHGAELCSADADFRRFDGLRWSNPLAGDS